MGQSRLDRVQHPRLTPIWMFALLFSALMNPLMLTGPLFMLQVYDRVIPSQSVPTLVTFFTLAVFIYVMMALLDSARVQIMARLAARFRASLDRPVFDARMQILIRDPNHVGALGSLRDLDSVHKALASPAILALLDTPWAFAFFGLLFLFHPALGLVALFGGLVLVGIAFWGHWRTQKPLGRARHAAAAADRLSQMVAVDADTLAAMGMSGAVADRWQALRSAGHSALLAAQDRSGFDGAFARAHRMMMQSAILAMGAWLVLQGELSPGLIVAASILMGRALAPVEQLATQWMDLRAAWAAWRRVQVLLSTMSRPNPAADMERRPDGTLSVQGLVVTALEGGVPILRIKGFDVRAGAAMGVIGPSGAGKSTLARALIGAVSVAAGSMRLGDTVLPVSFHSGHSVGYSPQKILLLEGTIAENIGRFDPAADRAGVERAARAAGVHELIVDLPMGYDTPAGGTAIRLSGGQVQRIGLARALYGDPQLVVLDEPIAHLDAAGSSAFNAAIRTLKANGVVVVVMAHRPGAITECDDLLVLEGGAQIAFGPRERVLRDMVRNHTAIVRPAVRGAS